MTFSYAEYNRGEEARSYIPRPIASESPHRQPEPRKKFTLFVVIAVLLIGLGSVSAYVWRTGWKLLEGPIFGSIALPPGQQIEILSNDVASLKALVNQLSEDKRTTMLSIEVLGRHLAEAQQVLNSQEAEIRRLTDRLEPLEKGLDHAAKPAAPPANRKPRP